MRPWRKRLREPAPASELAPLDVDVAHTAYGALVAIAGSAYALIHDLGRPERFYNMLRIARLTSPMSMGTWILSVYGPFAGAAAATELVPFLPGLPKWVHTIAPAAGRASHSAYFDDNRDASSRSRVASDVEPACCRATPRMKCASPSPGSRRTASRSQ